MSGSPSHRGSVRKFICNTEHYFGLQHVNRDVERHTIYMYETMQVAKQKVVVAEDAPDGNVRACWTRHNAIFRDGYIGSECRQ